MNTLNEFSVAHKHLPIEEPDNKLGKEIIKCMWIDAAEGIKLQCGREYEFSKSDARATQLEKLAPYELSRLPTNNLDTEKDLSKFNVSRQQIQSKKQKKSYDIVPVCKKRNVTNIAKQIRKV